MVMAVDQSQCAFKVMPGLRRNVDEPAVGGMMPCEATQKAGSPRLTQHCFPLRRCELRSLVRERPHL